MGESPPIDFEQIADAYKNGAIFAAFDLETTGLDPKNHRIVEIGAIKFDCRGIIANFSTLINPGIPMPPEAATVNGITDAMLSGKPDIKDVLPDFLSFVKNTIIMAHNAPFDSGFINENLVRELIQPVLTNITIDTIELAKKKMPGLKSYSLQKLAPELGLEAINAHRARDDARLCMEIFLNLIMRQ